MKIKKIRVHQIEVPKKHIFGLFFFLLAILSKGFGDALIASQNPESSLNLLKYIFLLISAIMFAYQSKNKKRLKFRSEYYSLLLCYFIIALISLLFSCLNGKFVFRTVKEFAFILSPIIFVYFAINTLKYNEIEFFAKISIVVYLISYFLEVGSNFSISNAILSISNFSISGGQASFAYDLLESSAFPDPVMALFCFFAYYKEENRKWLWLSYIGILLMNKRLIIVAATVILILSYIPGIKEKIKSVIRKRKFYFIPAIIFTVFPLLIYLLTQTSVEAKILQMTGINMSDFWMGRDVMVRQLISRGFKSYGLGSTYDFRDKLLEIESLKFFFETTIIGCITLSFTYWKITKNSIFSMIVMLYIFLNMNTSTSIITGAFAWIYYLFLIGNINWENRINGRIS